MQPVFNISVKCFLFYFVQQLVVMMMIPKRLLGGLSGRYIIDHFHTVLLDSFIQSVD